MNITEHSVVIVDDHILIAKALSSIIENFPHYTVLYEAEHGKALIEKFRQPKNVPDVVLLDITMPVMNGFETAEWLKQHYPEILVLTLSMQDNEQALIRMIKSGAKGYLLKNVHPAELEKALDSLVSNKLYYPGWATDALIKALRNDEKDDLSQREKEFLQYATTEMTYSEIAKNMYCSARTVESYRDALFERFNVKTRVGLVIYAIKKGMITV